MSAPWHELGERGSTLGLRATVWLYRHGGRGIARSLVYVIVAYFWATDAEGRRASRCYLERVRATPGGDRALERAPGRLDVFRHFLEFGRQILDRVGFWLGDRDDFALRVVGMDELERVARDGRGALILGSHLGSYDAMRLVAAARSPLTVHVLMYTRHASRINALFERLSAGSSTGDLRVRVLQVAPDGFQHTLEIKRRIDAGEVVALLADRVHPNERDRTAPVLLLGAPAALPRGPWLLAGALGCPVLLMTALRTGEAAYEISVERLADRIELPRQRRSDAVRDWCQRYADRLSSHCARAPYQWFNFYAFWDEDRRHAA